MKTGSHSGNWNFPESAEHLGNDNRGDRHSERGRVRDKLLEFTI